MIGGVMKKIQIAIFFFFFQSETKDLLLIIEKIQGKDERSSPTKYIILIKIRLKNLHYTRRTIHKGIGYLKDIQISSKPGSIPLNVILPPPSSKANQIE